MIYTFYSYKGGVGRSMAAANIARWYYLQGLRVALVDWDLEAPGLETFFFPPRQTSDGTSTPRPEVAAIQEQLGVIDLLTNFKSRFSALDGIDSTSPTETALRTLRQSLPALEPIFYRIEGGGEERGEGESAPGLWLLHAGRRAGRQFADYAQRVQSFDWNRFYQDYQGEAYFEWLREALDAFDVVIIDSRTGVTEMGGVCTRQLADVVVSFCGPNVQNLDGVTRMGKSIKRKEIQEMRPDRPLDVVVVPTRLDNNETDLRNDFERTFREKLSEVPTIFEQVNRTFWDLKIPYVPKYAYVEKLNIGAEDRAEELEEAYQRVAQLLALLAPEHGRLRRRLGERLQTAFPGLLPRVVVAAADGEAAAAAEELRGRLVKNGISLWRDPSAPVTAPLEDYSGVAERAESLAVVFTSGASEALLARLWRDARQSGRCVYLVRAGGEPARLPISMRGVREYAWPDDWERLLEQLGQPCRALRVPFMAPPLPDELVMRPKELARLKTALLAREDKTVFLGGPAGIGKTTLAALACHDEEVLAAFDGGILWANLDDACPVAGAANSKGSESEAAKPPGEEADAHKPQSAVLRELGRLWLALTGEVPDFGDRGEAAVRLAQALQGRRCLMVLNDARTARDLRPFLGNTEGCTYLIPTRDVRLADRDVGGGAGELITIGGLDSEQGVEMLARYLPDFAEKGQWQPTAAIVDRLGHSPMALHLAGSWLRDAVHGSGLEMEAAIEQFRKRVEGEGILAFDRPVSDSRSLARSITRSLDQLDPGDRARYYELAELPTEREIPLSEIQSRWPGLSERETRDLLEHLQGRSLLRYDRTSQSVRLHPILQAYLRHPRGGGAAEPVALPEARRTSYEALRQNPDVKRAKDVLQGAAASPEDLLSLAKALKSDKYFGLARLILARARQDHSVKDKPELRLTLGQQHALCTYKDPDLPIDKRLDSALEILKEVEDLKTTRVQETLGLAGAVFKRKWEADGRKRHLERSLAYYRRGYREGIGAPDFGYTAINAAFVLDLLADQEDREAEPAGASSLSAEGRRSEARRIREEIVAVLPPLANQPEHEWLGRQWWFLVTVAEAYFGLQRYDEARFWLAEARALPRVPDWEYESTARQLAALALLHDSRPLADLEGSPAWATLRSFLRDDLEAVRSSFVGKIGLALSGGGFRASLFHIGVLAKLAELDALRHVEVLSCVSGGSIVGAHYYLEVRKLLQSKRDEEISREDYIEIVKRLERDFLDGVQRNIRTRAMAHWLTNLRMILSSDYSRTLRVGELYEEHLFSRVKDGKEHRERYLNGLFVQPEGAPPKFSPKTDNWRRKTKVPILILNAATLNTGHNWQFTASWMGESPARIDTRVDGNERFRRLYYEEAPVRWRNLRLGHAVAASSCVPGLFEPLALPGLYPGRTVRLVDGGVQDNQGVDGLLEQDCSVLLVSDASGQMGAETDPSQRAFGVLARSNNMLMARVREAQYRELMARRQANVTRGLMFIHLRQDLEADPVDWLGCMDPHEASDEARPASRRGPLTQYGLPKAVQQRLAGVRTDLDSFSDAEAFALMLSGYRMTEHSFPRSVESFLGPQRTRPGEEWRFLGVEPLVRTPGEGFLRLLDVASRRAFRIWRLSAALQAVAVALGAAALFGLGWVGYKGLSEPSFTLTPAGLAWALLTLALTGVAVKTLRLAGHHRKPLLKLGFDVAMASLGWVAAGIHLLFFDRLYLRFGRLKRFRR